LKLFVYSYLDIFKNIGLSLLNWPAYLYNYSFGLNFIPTTDYATLFKEGLVNLIYSYFLGTISSFNNLHFCLVNYEFANLLRECYSLTIMI
jgi:hypothetical protein